MKKQEINESNDDHSDFLYDEITGGKGKKPVLSVLNKGKLSKFEMDELFAD